MPTGRGPLSYAVVGLGHIAQVAVLPAFAHAKRNCRLAALVSDDRSKLRAVARKYRVERTYSYDEYETCLDHVDAAYIALPNSMHAEYTIRAARAGVHVLCEKPMAVTADECQQMIDACREYGVKLMIAYRLHFEEINLAAVDLVRRGRIGDPKFFNSSFSMTVRNNDIRTKKDIRVAEIDESTGTLLRFDGERVAVFVTSFNAADVGSYEIVGTKGHLRVNALRLGRGRQGDAHPAIRPIEATDRSPADHPPRGEEAQPRQSAECERGLIGLRASGFGLRASGPKPRRGRVVSCD